MIGSLVGGPAGARAPETPEQRAQRLERAVQHAWPADGRRPEPLRPGDSYAITRTVLMPGVTVEALRIPEIDQ